MLKNVHISLYTTILNILVLIIKYILLNIENIEKVLTEYWEVSPYPHVRILLERNTDSHVWFMRTASHNISTLLHRSWILMLVSATEAKLGH